MKINFIFYHFLPNIGGTELPMYYYAKELVRRGHQVTVYTTNALMCKPSKLQDTTVIDGIKVERFKFFPVPINHLFFFAPSLIPKLFSMKTDIMVVFSLDLSFFLIVSCLIAKIRGIPLVLYPQFHPYRSTFSNFLERALDTFFIRTIGTYLLRAASYVIAITEAEADFCRKRGIKNVSIIYEGVPLGKPRDEAKISKFRNKYHLERKYNYLLAVGRIEKRKGFDFLIEAMPAILKASPMTRLLIVGADWGVLSKCKELVKRFKCGRNVLFLGFLSDEELECAYELADIVVIPSRLEIQSRIVLEAFSHRKPLVTTTSVGPQELIEIGGIRVTFGNHDAVARTVLKLLEDKSLAVKMGVNGYNLVRDFTWEKRTEKIENVFSFVHRSQSSLGSG